MDKIIEMYGKDIKTLEKIENKLEGTGVTWELVNRMKNGLRMVVNDLNSGVGKMLIRMKGN